MNMEGEVVGGWALAGNGGCGSLEEQEKEKGEEVWRHF